MLAGATIVGIALRDVFQAVVVPRAVNTVLRVSRYLVRGTWSIWPPLAYLLYPRNATAREDFLSMFAPLHLVTLLVMWVTMLVFGWGLIFYGLRDQLRPDHLSFAATVYYAGASLLTIGYGDIIAHSTLTRMLSLLAAASGLGVVAVVTSFLFAIFGAFQAREEFVVAIGARAGVPPSGIGLLEVHAFAGLRMDVATVFREGQAWAAAVMETHLAYPILLYFRSSHDYQSWAGTLGTLMDAAAIVMSTLDPAELLNPQSIGQAGIMYDIGRHLTRDFARYYNFINDEDLPSQPGVHRSEFDHAYERLGRTGFKLRDRDVSWTEFGRLRAAYGPHLNALARWLEVPPVQWIGDRSMIGH